MLALLWFSDEKPRQLRPILSFRHFIAVSFAAAAFAGATPDWKSNLTSPGSGTHPRLEPVSLDYQVSWKGIINSGNLHLDFAPPGEKKPGSYVVKAHAVSQGAAAQIHPFQFDSWSELNPSTLSPRYVRSTETDKNDKKICTVRYSGNRVESATSKRNFKSGKTKLSDHSFEFKQVFDIFSAMLQIRSQPLADGDHLNLVIQSSEQPIILRIHCIGRETHNGQNSIKLTAGIQKVDRDTLDLRPFEKLTRDATLWISDDYDRVPLEIRADIFVGDIRAVLIRRKKF